jgi:hypothetical protein
VAKEELAVKLISSDCSYICNFYVICSEPEPQILDYLTQQYKLFPVLAACFAVRFNAMWLWNMYNNVTAELEDGDLDRLPEV